MICKEISLLGQERMQYQQAAILVQEACKYTARILIEQGGKTVNVKSMIGILSLGMPTSEEMLLTIDGDDERQALDAIWPLMDTLFVTIE